MGYAGEKINPLPRQIREPSSLALGGIIREQRELRRWTLGELARRSGLMRHGLFLTESHQRVLLTDTVGRIGGALGMAGSALLALAEPRAAQWPAECRACNYCCNESGQLKYLDGTRGCIRAEH